jgi:hypothetical protein
LLGQSGAVLLPDDANRQDLLLLVQAGEGQMTCKMFVSLLNEILVTSEQ